MSYDELLDILAKAEDAVMHSFNQNIINESVHEEN